ncbi:unnamed protein product [Fraxinus pennsylvanica]|uniref:RNase H type-1 domain-containing protein n=1 Tax=Fraxinus pennsylvanica TaxID=56036 RepID=A0AAD1ZEX3_9LAMI|nr:unnamed protein product [Fraxinus pennsylvanica]
MLNTIASSFKKFRKIKVSDREILDRLNVPIALISMVVPQLVSWKKPGSGTMKLNVDGGSNGNPGAAGGGGPIRDSRGRLIAGFAHFYGVATNTLAESRALRDELAMCKERGWVDFVVESYSMLMVKWAQDGDALYVPAQILNKKWLECIFQRGMFPSLITVRNKAVEAKQEVGPGEDRQSLLKSSTRNCPNAYFSRECSPVWSLLGTKQLKPSKKSGLEKIVRFSASELLYCIGTGSTASKCRHIQGKEEVEKRVSPNYVFEFGVKGALASSPNQAQR